VGLSLFYTTRFLASDIFVGEQHYRVIATVPELIITFIIDTGMTFVVALTQHVLLKGQEHSIGDQTAITLPDAYMCWSLRLDSIVNDKRLSRLRNDDV